MLNVVSASAQCVATFGPMRQSEAFGKGNVTPKRFTVKPQNVDQGAKKNDAHRSNIDPLIVRHVTQDREGHGPRQQARGRVHQARDHRVPDVEIR